jgi:DNA-binding CsgD family transcriptional regulator
MSPAPYVSKSEDERPDGESIAEGAIEHRPSGIHPRTGHRKSRAKWTVVKTFVSEGQHFQLRCRPIELRGHDADLTKREEQVLACAMDGQSNKSIAYALGVAPSTVGVLLFRAATKLGVKSRSELITAYARRKPAASRAANDPTSLSGSESRGVSKARPVANDGIGTLHAPRGVDPAK